MFQIRGTRRTIVSAAPWTRWLTRVGVGVVDPGQNLDNSLQKSCFQDGTRVIFWFVLIFGRLVYMDGNFGHNTIGEEGKITHPLCRQLPKNVVIPLASRKASSTRVISEKTDDNFLVKININ